MCQHRNPLHCLVPPFVLENMAKSSDPRVRRWAIDNIAASSAARAKRTALAFAPNLLTSSAPEPCSKMRVIYDAERGWRLPGKVVRKEGDAATKDTAVTEAYDFSGDTWEFYNQVFNRCSLDDRGMVLVSSVHVGTKYGNAFWDGQQMGYGDGDGKVFDRMTRSLDVVGHELTHGVISFTSNLVYQNEPGALNEHFADVFGALVTQWTNNQSADQASWLIGQEIVKQAKTRKAIRSMENPGSAFRNDPYMGNDPQPKHYSKKYKGSDDYGGVHINSGIPNHAFYLAATAIGGRAWEHIGRVWYRTMTALSSTAEFIDCARMSVVFAGDAFGAGSAEQRAIIEAWESVGLKPVA